MGMISLVNVTPVCVDTGGSLLTSMLAAESEKAPAAAPARMIPEILEMRFMRRDYGREPLFWQGTFGQRFKSGTSTVLTSEMA